jgi:hypothetical protein
LLFSSSSYFSRRISLGNKPSCFFFQLKGSLADPGLTAHVSDRHAVDALFRMNAFWASENRDAFMALRSSQPGNRRGKL